MQMQLKIYYLMGISHLYFVLNEFINLVEGENK